MREPIKNSVNLLAYNCTDTLNHFKNDDTVTYNVFFAFSWHEHRGRPSKTLLNEKGPRETTQSKIYDLVDNLHVRMRSGICFAHLEKCDKNLGCF